MSWISEVNTDSPDHQWRVGDSAMPLADTGGGSARTLGTGTGTPVFNVNSLVPSDSSNGALRLPSADVRGNRQSESPQSILCWMKPASIGSVQFVMFYKDGVGNGGMMLRLNADGTLTGQFRTDAAVFVATDSSTVLIAGQVYYVDVTWDAVVGLGASVLIYVNGQDVSDGAGSTFTVGANGIYTLGSQGAGASLYNGDIDEANIWLSTTLTPSRIAAHFLAGKRRLRNRITRGQRPILGSFNR